MGVILGRDFKRIVALLECGLRVIAIGAATLPAVWAQVPELAWQRSLYASGNAQAVLGSGDVTYAKRAMVLDAAGNTYVTGTTYNGTDTDVLTIKYDPSGTIVWRAVANGPARKDDVSYAIAVDPAGNVAVGGATNAGAHWDALVIKYDSAGSELWRRTFDGGVVRDDYAYDVAFAANGDVVMAGATGVVAFGASSNFLVQRYAAADGATIWSKQADGMGQGVDRANAMVIDAMDNVFVTGYSTGASGNLEMLTVKYAPDGTELARARNGGVGLNNIGTAIAQDGAGSVVVTGTSYVLGNANFLTVKYDASLVEAWSVLFNGGQDAGDGAQAVALDSGGNIFVFGTTDRDLNQPLGAFNPAYALVKYLPDGSFAWSRSFEGSGTGNEFASALATDGAGNAVVAAFAGSGGIYVPTLFKLDASGNELWRVPLSGLPAQDGAALVAARVNGSGDILAAGSAVVGGNGDFVVARISSAGGLLWRASEGSATGLATSFAGGLTQAGALGVDATGTIYVAGHTGNATGADFLTASLNASGGVLWQKTANGSGGQGDQAIAVSPLTGGAFVGGDSTVGGALRQMLVKYDSAGNETWRRVISGAGSTQDTVKAVLADGGGDVFITGTTNVAGNVDFFSVYVNGVSGNEIWRSQLGNPAGADVPVAMVRDSTNNLYVAGSSVANGVESIRIVKHKLDGQPDWHTVIDPPTGAIRLIRALAIDGAGALVAGGDLVIKLRPDGSLLWSVNPGIIVHAIAIGQDNSVHVGGSNGAFIKYDTDGRELWRAAVNGVEDANNLVSALGTDILGAVYAASRNSADPLGQYVVSKVGATGQFAWRMEFPTLDVDGAVPPAMRVLPDRSVILAGNAARVDAPSAMSVWKIIQPTPAPTLNAAIPGNAQATFYFDPPDGDGGSAITSYSVFCNGGLVTASGAASPMTLSGLSNGTAYTCHVTANNLFGNGRASNALVVTPQLSPPLQLVEAFSSKSHGSAGTFERRLDITKPAAGAVGIEPRQLGTSQSLRLRFNAMVNSVGSANVENHLGQTAGSATAVPSGMDVMVTLTGIAHGSRVRLLLGGLNGSASAEVSLAYQVGDINATGLTSAADLAAVKSRSGGVANAQFFLYDVDGSGTINSTDISVVKGKLGTRLP